MKRWLAEGKRWLLAYLLMTTAIGIFSHARLGWEGNVWDIWWIANYVLYALQFRGGER